MQKNMMKFDVIYNGIANNYQTMKLEIHLQKSIEKTNRIFQMPVNSLKLDKSF